LLLESQVVEKRIYLAYYVLMLVVLVMAVVMWGSAQPHLNDFWRFMYFLCADILLTVIVVGTWWVTKRVT